LGDNDDFLLANETIMKALDPILVLRPSSRHGYNYDMMVIHLSECDIYYAKRLKDVPQKMTFSEFNERYENQNYIVIARVKDYEDENFGIYRRKNNNEIKWIYDIAVGITIITQDEQIGKMNWSEHIMHLRSATEPDERRGKKTFVWYCQSLFPRSRWGWYGNLVNAS